MMIWFFSCDCSQEMNSYLLEYGIQKLIAENT